MAWLTKILHAISTWVGWYYSDRQQASRDKDAQDKAKAEAIAAVKNQDTDAVNDILRRNLGILLVGTVLVLGLAGCATPRPPVYLPEEDKVIPIEWQGKAGWFVPQRVFEAIMAKMAEKGD